ncbi:alpha/beta-hydrolase [Microstroma glucosiphilum]|uniref:Alpha/beta-hydrolase n=1 Tax=Pseudomicrostroma glucosiphilum TaxID=1684307 RepID=A0A316TZ10_9BASI|nr:alpha/beta-hydrolase [Pseudomicrostroma glucosiphilum]PWN17924.1 alpha/beta-hydrolase [Pseudomicrostroma glucosiphilum]
MVERVSYGSHARQVIDLYSPTTPDAAAAAPLPLLVFLHGGAWRTGDIATHHDLAASLAKARVCCVALVEYRLSLPSAAPDQSGGFQNQHPAHIQDTHLALKLLLVSAPKGRYNLHRAVLVGHSIGAWLLCSLLLDCTAAFNIPRPSPPPLSSEELATIRQAVHAWVLVDGIYDIDDLLVEYPDYAGFVSQAFVPLGDPPLAKGGDERLRAVSIPAWPAAKEPAVARVILAHSKDDELLTFRQIRAATEYLRGILGREGIQEDHETLTGKHDDLLQTHLFRNWLESIVLS